MTFSDSEDRNSDGYIVEYVIIGNSVKVTAFDPVTLREVSIVGAPTATREQLANLVIRKLIYMNEKDTKNPGAS